MTRIREEIALFLLAVQFLTRVPIPSSVAYSEARMNAAARYYPLVGLLVGTAAALVFMLTSNHFYVMFAVLFSTVATVLLTGAFHEDGFADMCDGIGGGTDRERALEIMKDSRLGTYGALGLGLLVACKVFALVHMDLGLVPYILIAAHGISRFSSVVAIATSRYVRGEGTAKPTADGISGGGFLVALLTAALPLCALALGKDLRLALVVAAGALAGHIAARFAYQRKLGGYTGDCLGAVQQLSELGIYLGIVAYY